MATMINYEVMKRLVPMPGSEPIWQNVLHLMKDLLSPLAETPQDPRWHPEGDVWTHTMMVVQVMVLSDMYEQATLEERFVLFYACLFHDIGKPGTTKHEPDGSISSKGHSGRGEVDARIFMWHAGVPFTLREQICSIIRHHLTPFFIYKKSGTSEEALAKVRKLSHQVGRLDLLIAVCNADMRGRTYVNMEEELTNLALVREAAESEGCLYEPFLFMDKFVAHKYFETDGSIPIEVLNTMNLCENKGSTVVVMCGTPASGKDTYVQEMRSKVDGGMFCYKDAPIISFDDAAKELGLKLGGNIGEAIHLANDRAKELLRKKASFYWNATHLSKQLRSKTIQLCRDYNATVLLAYLEATPATVYERNNNRDTTLSNKKLDEMLYHWEMPDYTEAHWVAYTLNEDRKRQSVLPFMRIDDDY